MNKYGFILAIDSYLIRKGLVALLNRIPGVVVRKEFDAGPPLREFLRNHAGEYLLISQSIFDGTIDLFLSESRLLEKTILVTTLSAHQLNEDFQALIDPGASKDQITRVITEVLDAGSDQGPFIKDPALTEREKTIVRLVSMGHTNKQIADQLFLSAHTVITHRKNINSKLGIKSVSGLTIYAIVNNIITIDEVTSKPDQ
jgi:DNA-binding CsgD family transcriptional regulator